MVCLASAWWQDRNRARPLAADSGEIRSNFAAKSLKGAKRERGRQISLSTTHNTCVELLMGYLHRSDPADPAMFGACPSHKQMYHIFNPLTHTHTDCQMAASYFSQASKVRMHHSCQFRPLIFRFMTFSRRLHAFAFAWDTESVSSYTSSSLYAAVRVCSCLLYFSFCI